MRIGHLKAGCRYIVHCTYLQCTIHTYYLNGLLFAYVLYNMSQASGLVDMLTLQGPRIPVCPCFQKDYIQIKKISYS